MPAAAKIACRIKNKIITPMITKWRRLCMTTTPATSRIIAFVSYYTRLQAPTPFAFRPTSLAHTAALNMWSFLLKYLALHLSLSKSWVAIRFEKSMVW